MALTDPTPIELAYARDALPPASLRWLLRPIGWPYFLCAATACLYGLWGARVPGFPSAAFTSLFILAVIWGLRVGLQLFLGRIYKQRRSDLRPYALAMLFPAVMALLLISELPLRIGFYFSEPAMRREAETIIATGAVPTTPIRVGWYDMSEIHYFSQAHSVQFFVKDSGFIDTDEGWTHCSDPTLPKEANYARNEAIGGGWYRTVRGH